MPIICPKCGHKLKVFNIKASFTCPSCKSELRGKITGAIISAILVSIIADLIIFPISYNLSGTNWWPGMVARVIASAVILFGALAFMINKFGSVEARDDLPKSP